MAPPRVRHTSTQGRGGAPSSSVGGAALAEAIDAFRAAALRRAGDFVDEFRSQKRVPPGVYAFEWAGGSFDVELRNDGKTFWCRAFPDDCAYDLRGDELRVDFGKFGTFDFREAHLGVWEGHRHTDEADWRRCVFKRSLTPAEQLVSGSAWDLHFKRGTPFRVEFHASGAFHAPDYPGDFTWDMTDGAVVVHWGKYGTFDLDKIDVKRKALSGAKRGDPGNWRKLEFVEALPCYLPADPLE